MRDPSEFDSPSDLLQYLAGEYENLHASPLDPIDYHYRLRVIHHDLDALIRTSLHGLPPEWQTYARDSFRTVEETMANAQNALSPKQRSRSDFLYRAVIARREQEVLSEARGIHKAREESRIDRAKLTGVIVLFGVLLVATLFVARALYIADTNFFEVVRSGNLRAVRPRILLGKSVHSTDNRGRTALHHAAEMGHVDLAEYLLRRGADVHLTDDEGMSPLHEAAGSGSADIVNLLIGAGADVHLRNTRNHTPLMELARKGVDYERTRACAQLLIDAGADVNANDGNDSVLSLAILQAGESYGRNALKLATYLVGQGADVHFIGKNHTTVIGNALLKYLPRRVDPSSASATDPLIAYLIDQGALETYRQTQTGSQTLPSLDGAEGFSPKR